MDDIEKNESPNQLEGRKPVWEALKAGRSVDKLIIQNSAHNENINGIIGLARRSGIIIDYVPKERIAAMAQTENHQGVIAVMSAASYTELDDMLDDAFKKTDSPVFAVLDEVQDPHNLGAVIRSADCFGVNGVIITKRRSASVTAAAAKASAGAVEHMPIAKVDNLRNTLIKLKERGVWVIGADSEGKDIADVDMTGPTAIVLGNEGSGIRPLVRQECDQLAAIPMSGNIGTLNVSVAAGVFLYEAARRRKSGNV